MSKINRRRRTPTPKDTIPAYEARALLEATLDLGNPTRDQRAAIRRALILIDAGYQPMLRRLQ